MALLVKAAQSVVQRLLLKDASNDNCYDFGVRGMTE